MPTNTHGPAIRSVDPWDSLSRENASVAYTKKNARDWLFSRRLFELNKGEEIYSEGQRADAVFNIITEVVKAYKTAPDGSEHITAFLFPDDIFGLSEEGRYTNSAKALTPLALYRFPLTALRRQLAKDADLEFHVICKLIHELRETQRHAFLLAQRRALSRMAMFLQLLENLQAGRGERTAEIYLPMTRVGMLGNHLECRLRL